MFTKCEIDYGRSLSFSCVMTWLSRRPLRLRLLDSKSSLVKLPQPRWPTLLCGNRSSIFIKQTQFRERELGHILFALDPTRCSCWLLLRWHNALVGLWRAKTMVLAKLARALKLLSLEDAQKRKRQTPFRSLFFMFSEIKSLISISVHDLRPPWDCNSLLVRGMRAWAIFNCAWCHLLQHVVLGHGLRCSQTANGTKLRSRKHPILPRIGFFFSFQMPHFKKLKVRKIVTFWSWPYFSWHIIWPTLLRSTLHRRCRCIRANVRVQLRLASESRRHTIRGLIITLIGTHLSYRTKTKSATTAMPGTKTKYDKVKCSLNFSPDINASKTRGTKLHPKTDSLKHPLRNISTRKDQRPKVRNIAGWLARLP